MFKIYTDSPANLPTELVEKFDLEVLPLYYTLNGEEFPSTEKGKTEFDGKAFYNAMREGASVQTSLINADTFCAAFENSLAAGFDVISISISSGVSGTYHAAFTAAEEMRKRYPERKIATIDTRAAGLAEGLLVLHAAQMQADGASFEEVVQSTEAKSAFICQYFTVEDLIYLRKGGRISGAAALVGSILHIKPILMGDEEGKIVLHHKTRGRKKALEALAAKYLELVADLNAPVAITHADSEEDANHLAQMIKDRGYQGEVLMNCFEPVNGSHVGPGALALFFYGVHR